MARTALHAMFDRAAPRGSHHPARVTTAEDFRRSSSSLRRRVVGFLSVGSSLRREFVPASASCASGVTTRRRDVASLADQERARAALGHIHAAVHDLHSSQGQVPAHKVGRGSS